MKHSNTLEKISPALVKALGEMRGAVKDSKNPHFRNDYASLESVIEASRPVLAEHGLAFMQGLGEYANGAMTVSTRIIHESGEWIESDFQMPVGKADPQGTASASTYARRYSLMGILGLPALDDDGEAAMPRNQKPEAKPNVSVDNGGPDWWKCQGAGEYSAYAIKKDHPEVAKQFDDWMGLPDHIHTAQEWKDWCEKHTPEIAKLPKSWRQELRAVFEDRGKELGVFA